MSETLTDDHHDWASTFLGVDTRDGASGASPPGGEERSGGFLDTLSNAAHRAVDTVSDAAGSVKDKAVEVAGEVKDKAVEVAGEVKDKAVEVATDVKDKAVEVATEVKDKTVEVAGEVKDKVVSAEHAVAEKASAAYAAAAKTNVGEKPPPDTPADPAKQQLYLKEKKDGKEDSTDVSEDDIHQGQVGDCFVLSSVGEIAKLKPDVIKKMIKDNGDGTYTVTLHQQDDGIGNAWGLFSHDYKEVQVKVNGDVPAASVNHGDGQAEDGGKKEIWPLLLEKAYAQVNGGYGEIDKGGDPKDALQTFTGKDAETKSASSVSLDDLQNAAKDGKPMVFNTPDDDDGILQKLHISKSKKLPFGMHGNHAYMFEGLETGKDGKTYVRLKNPWGYDDPQLIPYDQLTKAVDSVSTGSM